MKAALILKYRKIDFSLDIEANILNTRIYTTESLDSEKREEDELGENEKYFVITIEVQLKEYESIVDAAAHARPQLLIALGIVSLITQRAFTPFEFYGGRSLITKDKLEENEIMFLYNGVDYSVDFIKIQQYVVDKKDHEKRLLYSLLDRWRKAIYLEESSEESLLHDDEILLSYFHTLELLSSEYYKSQKVELTKLIDSFTSEIMSKIYLSKGRKLENDFREKKKILEGIIVSDLSVGNKILYMLKEQNLLNDRVASFIASLIQDRNAVAHGRQVYQDKVIYPVPPFFPLIRKQTYSFDLLRVLTARSIAIFVGLELHKEDWEELEIDIFPPIEKLDEFIAKKTFTSLSNKEFVQGKIENITPYTISHYLLEGKLKPKIVILILENFINNFGYSEEEIHESILAIIIIADHANEGLKEKCIEIIKRASDKEWIPFGYSKFRDVLYYLEYLGIKTDVLETLIADDEIK